jgi:alkaline phosphatase
MNYAVGQIISIRAKIGWTTGGHTGGEVVLYTYSPTQDRLTGVVDNTDLAKYMARVLGVDLAQTNGEKTFVPLEAINLIK